jgi:CheY-like chemotaxis protein
MNKTLKLFLKNENYEYKLRNVPERYKIFLVEDSDCTRELLHLHLEKSLSSEFPDDRVSVSSYESGENCLLDVTLQPDIVVLDYFLTGFNELKPNGLDLLRKIREKSPNTKFIFITGSKDYSLISSALEEGACDYILKDQFGRIRLQYSCIRVLKNLKKLKGKPKLLPNVSKTYVTKKSKSA